VPTVVSYDMVGAASALVCVCVCVCVCAIDSEPTSLLLMPAWRHSLKLRDEDLPEGDWHCPKCTCVFSYMLCLALPAPCPRTALPPTSLPACPKSVAARVTAARVPVWSIVREKNEKRAAREEQAKIRAQNVSARVCVRSVCM
jgi:hypothetical protein